MSWRETDADAWGTVAGRIFPPTLTVGSAIAGGFDRMLAVECPVPAGAVVPSRADAARTAAAGARSAVAQERQRIRRRVTITHLISG
ncbi:hypothetical protein AA12717_0544 [Gluconacetobacter sacchari DSM 12717]|uniref:Uncharacterized protein n=1 Tax=Gluconacetobacter sacchari DSM 12717 TaxID=1307940 RepID=A0ABQ0P3G2_9PROT|nr:hypothetical protein AA12717_0544 [Gluconacetobacter sacchari DSM 12717]